MIQRHRVNLGEACVRQQLVEQIRRELASGEYDTEEKFEAAFWRMVSDLGLEGEFHVDA